MRLSKVAGLLDTVINPVSRLFHIVGVGVLVAMMLLTTGDVLLRYVFNRPIIGSYDLTQYMMTIVVAFTLAYCAVKKGHVKVELVVERFPPRVQVIIDSVTSLLSLGFLSLITWQSFLYAKELFNSKIVSSVLRIPNFPFAYLVSFGVACFTLALLVDFIHNLSEAAKR
ncbi:hypothetical protein ES703_79286 [subsurface metagenome]